MAPGGLVEVRVNWPGHSRYLKKKNDLKVVGGRMISDETMAVLQFLLLKKGPLSPEG